MATAQERRFNRRDRHLHQVSADRLGLREFPFAAENLRPWPIKPHGVIPPFRDGQAVRNFAVASAELNGDRAIRIFLPGDAIQRIGVVRILLEVSLRVVDADRPSRSNTPEE